VLALTPSAASAARQRAYVHNNRNNPITKKTTASGSLFFFPEKLGQCFFFASLLLAPQGAKQKKMGVARKNGCPETNSKTARAREK
jgi:hypothetical protein